MIKYIQAYLRNRKYKFFCSGSYLWRRTGSDDFYMLSGNIPNNWTPSPPGQVSTSMDESLGLISFRQAYAKFPNAL